MPCKRLTLPPPRYHHHHHHHTLFFGGAEAPVVLVCVPRRLALPGIVHCAHEGGGMRKCVCCVCLCVQACVIERERVCVCARVFFGGLEGRVRAECPQGIRALKARHSTHRGGFGQQSSMVQGRGRLHVHVQGVDILSGCSGGDACMCAEDDQHTEVRVGCVWEGRWRCMCVVWADGGGEGRVDGINACIIAPESQYQVKHTN